MKAIAIIPARGGSTRIPRKNIRAFHGKPILAYSIETARASRLFDEIVVSTDHADVVAIAKGYGAKVHMRAAKLCENDVGTQEVARAVLQWWQASHNGQCPEYACCIYATAPMMEVADLTRGLACLDPAWVDYAFSVGGNDFPFEDAGQFYWGRTEAFLAGRPLGDPAVNTLGNTILVHLQKHRVCDINTEEDWRRAEVLYAELQQARRIAAQIDDKIFKEQVK